MRYFILLSVVATASVSGCTSSSSPPSISSEGQAFSDRITAQYDLNSDGLIDKGEIDQVRLEQFVRLDRNKDGFLTPAEIDSMRANIPLARRPLGDGQGRRDPFSRLDTDADGMVSRDEFEASDPIILSRSDLNGDGAVSKSELDTLISQFQSRRRP